MKQIALASGYCRVGEEFVDKHSGLPMLPMVLDLASISARYRLSNAA